MAERPVTDVVQQGCKPRGISILWPDLWYVLVAVVAEISPMSGVSLKGSNHAFSSFHHSSRVLEAVVSGAWIDEMRHPKLPNPA